MIYDYKKEYTVSFSQLDSTFCLGLANALVLMEDMMTEYFGTFGSDNITLKEKNNALWVYTKTKIEINRLPMWRELIKARSYSLNLKAIRTELESSFVDESGKQLFVAKQEICPIDIETRKIRRISTVNYPNDMEFCETKITSDFTKMNDCFAENDFVYKQKVMFSDVDHNSHTNNIAYVRYVLNTFTSDFFDKHKVNSFEIHYLNESKEGATLSIYRKDLGNSVYFLIKEDEKEIVKCLLNYS